ncbi:MAG TPA: tRNA lysidine(34) synthetase TilS [Thiobacillus sp.]
MARSLAHHVPPHARITLALSGGLDSIVLLHVLTVLRTRHPFELQAIHVNHGLSPHASEWADFCAQYCQAQCVALGVHHVTIAPQDPAGIEGAARRERHRIFALQDADYLLTAHHQNDQAETLLLQLLRGAGPKGLSAMAEIQPHSDWRAAQLRPLLAFSRAELHRYAVAHALAWVEDESNLDLRYRRNALRQQVIPLLEAHFPATTITLARAARLQAESAELLDDLAQLDASTAIRGDRLDCTALAALSVARARNLLRYFIGTHGWSMPNSRRLDEALHQLLDARQAATVCVNLGEVALHRFRGGAYLVPRRIWAPQPALVWRGELSLTLESIGAEVRFTPVQGAGLKRELLDAGKVELRLREGQEKIRLIIGGPHRKLKNLLQESAIPPWERDRLPLLVCDGQLVWAAGIGLHADCLAGPGDVGIMLSVV